LRYKKLGRSGLLVSEVCLGGMLFGEESARGTPPEEAKRMVHRYLDAGGNYIDTADHYGSGRSEEIIGEAVEGRRDEVVLATKGRYSDDPRGPNDEGLSRYRVMRAVEGSLRRLRTDHIDLYTMGGWTPSRRWRRRSRRSMTSWPRARSATSASQTWRPGASRRRS